MKKKDWIIGIIAVLVIVALLFLIPKKPKIPVYSDNPKDWIEDLPDNRLEINVTEATKGESYVDINGQQFSSQGILTAFNFEGWYNGHWFYRQYYDENDQKIMEIGQDMAPRDGIIEGFIFERFENDELYVYVVLDEDWKNKLPNTKIYWGKTYQNEKDFDFSKMIENGIYVDKVKEDMTRFNDDFTVSEGGVYVGELREKGSTIISLS